jgi:hypothetical protein
MFRGSDANFYQGLHSISSIDVGVTQDLGVNLTYYGSIAHASTNQQYYKDMTDDKFQAMAKFRLIRETKSIPSFFAGYAQRINGGSFAFGMASKKFNNFLGQDTSFYGGVTVETNNVDNYMSHSDPTSMKKSSYLWGGIMRPINKNQDLCLEFDGINTNLAYRIRIKKIDLELKAYGTNNTKFGAGLGYSFDL